MSDVDELNPLHLNDDDDDEEEECRVCRGPAEEGHPLFKPCKCSGSIGLTHQDCLQSWLQVQRGGAVAGMGGGGMGYRGRCELCKTPFRFVPVYAPETPLRLLPAQVLWGVLHCACCKWLPFLARSAFAASLWLLVAPLLTAYLYQAWMHRPMAILERLDMSLVSGDLVSGAVVAAVVIISFLSLMSFADFLRVEINNNPAAVGVGVGVRVPAGGGVALAAQQQQRMVGAGAVADRDNDNNLIRLRRQGPEEPELDPTLADVDNELWIQSQRQQAADSIRESEARRQELVRNNNFIRAVDSVGDSDDDDDDDDDDEEEASEDSDYHEDEEEEEDDEEDASWDPQEDDDNDNEDDDDHEEDELAPLFPLEMVERHMAEADVRARGIMHGNNNNNNNNAQHQAAGGNDMRMPPLEPAGARHARFENNNNRDNMDILLQQQPGAGLMGGGGVGGIDDIDAMGGEMDINIALDELLGIRGPLGGVLKNLMWLLAFNAAYLGFFAFTPRVVGMAATSILFNATTVFTTTSAAAATVVDAAVNATTLLLAEGVNETESTFVASPLLVNGNSSLLDILRAVEAESERQNTTFRLSVLVSVGVGYLSCACVVLLLKCLWILSRKVQFLKNGRGGTARTAGNHQQQHHQQHHDVDEVRDALDEINRIMMMGGNIDDVNQLGEGEGEQGIAISFAIGVALDVMTAIVKVGVLLLLKMFLLPIALGLCLDASTLSLFGSTLEDRVLYAGRDLFSFTLLHWVAGITFMLLVTVSVLQLREVTHPDLLAEVIRPQEPQPDLLGNLMHENVATHAKRMVLSLVIYAALLGMHVYIPINLLASSGIAKWLPFLQVKVSYIMMPQLQVPLELLFFHLCMLGILEKNKNSIGEMQHHWLKFMCRHLGFIESTLPRTVAQFRLVGLRPIYYMAQSRHVVDPFWRDLAKADNKKAREDMIRSKIDTFLLVEDGEEELVNAGETKANGERVLRFGSDYIRIPVRLCGRALRIRSLLLPTKIGRYRLKRDVFNDDCPVFQLWEEIPGDLVPRPPEGWDDLGAGGADIQGRWAWGRERKSNLERGVACRNNFYDDHDSPWRKLAVACKMLTLVLLSWATTTVSLFCLVLGPLAIGRFFYYILRFQDKWIHDPLAYAIGSVFFFPLMRSFLKSLVCAHDPLSARFAVWVSHFHPPPAPKLMVLVTAAVLWFGVAPWLLGMIVDIWMIKPTSWFDGKEPLVDNKSMLLNWITGNILLGIWIELCFAGVLTKRFYESMFEAPGAAPVEREEAGGNDVNGGDAAAAAAVENVENDHVPEISWQGERGRAARFVDVWTSARNFEWDKVEPSALIHDVVMPVSVQLSLTLLFPCTAMGLCFWRFPMLTGFWRVVFVRGVLLLAVLAQSARVWQDQVRSWFEAAHQAARDDRYLIGEVLMNHNEQ